MASSTGEVARVFLRLGLTAFGGPAAHIALFREEFVARRRWIDDGEFLHLLAAANLIPGPTSTELAMHLGHRRAGWPGLLAAGLGFLLPAALIVGGLAWAYVSWGFVPVVGAILAGIAPVVVAIVAHATVGLGRASLADPARWGIAAIAALATLAGVAPLPVLLVAAVAALVVRSGSALTSVGREGLGAAGLLASAVVLPQLGALTTAAASTGAPGLAVLALTFAKVGALLFGSGYLIVALLDAELVTGMGVLTRRELLDAVAIGQVTPGPVITTATFIGYQLDGWPGAVVATVAIAAPAFAFVALSAPMLGRLRRSVTAQAALDWVAAAVVGTLAATTAQLAATAVVNPLSALLAAGGVGLLVSGRVGSVALIALGAAVGATLHLVGGWGRG